MLFVRDARLTIIAVREAPLVIRYRCARGLLARAFRQGWKKTGRGVALARATVTDPNGNRVSAAFDVLGQLTATAVLGKATEAVGTC